MTNSQNYPEFSNEQNQLVTLKLGTCQIMNIQQLGRLDLLYELDMRDILTFQKLAQLH